MTKLAYVYWYRSPSTDSDQFNEISLRRIDYLVNKDRARRVNIAHIMVSSLEEIDHEGGEPTMVIKCGAGLRTEITAGVYCFCSFGELEKAIVAVVKEKFPDGDRDHPELPLDVVPVGGS